MLIQQMEIDQIHRHSRNNTICKIKEDQYNVLPPTNAQYFNISRRMNQLLWT